VSNHAQDDQLREGHRVGVSLMKSEEANAIIELLEEEMGEALTVNDLGPFYRLEADDKIEIRFADVADILGSPFGANDFHVVFSTYYGRPVADDEMIGIYSEMLQLGGNGNHA
jgi:hypothetical protein